MAADPELVAKLDTLISMVKDMRDEHGARLSQLERTVQGLDGRVQGLDGQVQGLQEAQRDHTARLAHLKVMAEDLQRAQQAHAERLARLDGKYDVMLAWLQSTDQRFSALMAPFSPPKKPAA